jgi:hypothetical protein
VSLVEFFSFSGIFSNRICACRHFACRHGHNKEEDVNDKEEEEIDDKQEDISDKEEDVDDNEKGNKDPINNMLSKLKRATAVPPKNDHQKRARSGETCHLCLQEAENQHTIVQALLNEDP